MKFNLLEKIRPEFFFLYVSLCFGLIILVITPPFQVPDEINHFYRAYQIAEGDFVSIKKDNRVGGYVPASLVKITEPFLRLRWNEKQKIDKAVILKQLNVPLLSQEKVFVDFPNTSAYSLLSYLPQASSMLLFRSFSLSPMWIFYLARLFALIFWVFCIFYSIKIIPIYKWFFCLVALLPMSLFVNMSLSADVEINALAFILIAYILRIAYSDKNISEINFVFIILLAVILAFSKIVYTPLIFIFLIIPINKFKSSKNFYIKVVLLFFLSFAAALIWSNVISKLYIPYELYNPNFRDTATLVKDADMHKQLAYILNHGTYFFQVMYDSITKTFDMYFEGYIGTFGWLDTNLPKWLVIVSYLIIFIIAFISGGHSIEITTKNKFILFFSFAVSLVLLLLSQHLTWDVVGGDRIGTIQGRYLIPILPLLFLICKNSKFNYIKFVPHIVIIFSALSLIVTTYTLLTRYYS